MYQLPKAVLCQMTLQCVVAKASHVQLLYRATLRIFVGALCVNTVVLLSSKT